jgi:enoyl-CoA hydratase/carnithine racemase
VLFRSAIGKQGFYAQIDQPDDSAMHYAKHTIAMNLTAEDAQNGIAAFIEKKPPVWNNR